MLAASCFIRYSRFRTARSNYPEFFAKAFAEKGWVFARRGIEKFMGLDACVYCNCFETGKLRQQPPLPDRVFVMDDGSLDYRCDDLEQTMLFDRWLLEEACEHRNGWLLLHHLGNMSLIAFVRDQLHRQAERFPILLEKVVYSGIHGGDWLAFGEVVQLEKEVSQLQTFVVDDPKEQHWIDEFRDKLVELIDAAKSVRKPISF